MSADLERFYDLLGLLEEVPGQGRRLADLSGRSDLPSRGVYFFREPGEQRSRDPRVSRIVRVGTHALKTGETSTLSGRLRAHRGYEDGGGNHRGSIFRRHVGAAMLNSDGIDRTSWGRGSTAPRAVRDSEGEHERRVSAYLGETTVLWVAVPDEPGPASRRGSLERAVIALLSNNLSPEDRPSAAWLGRYSIRHEIRASGLWNVKHTEDPYPAASFLDELETLITSMRR